MNLSNINCISPDNNGYGITPVTVLSVMADGRDARNQRGVGPLTVSNQTVDRIADRVHDRISLSPPSDVSPQPPYSHSPVCSEQPVCFFCTVSVIRDGATRFAIWICAGFGRPVLDGRDVVEQTTVQPLLN